MRWGPGSDRGSRKGETEVRSGRAGWLNGEKLTPRQLLPLMTFTKITAAPINSYSLNLQILT